MSKRKNKRKAQQFRQDQYDAANKQYKKYLSGVVTKIVPEKVSGATTNPILSGVGILGGAAAKIATKMAPKIYEPIVWCTHWRDPVKVGDYVVYASGSRAITDNEMLKEPRPTAGIYLSNTWYQELTGFAAVGMVSPVLWHWPFLQVDWPDMGVMHPEEIKTLVKATVRLIKAGKRVEIACMGGHGRTGTLLALLRVKLGGMKAAEAIESIRADYCDKTVESIKQIDAVYTYSGEEIPTEGKPKAAKMGYASSWGLGAQWGGSHNTTPICATCDHWEVAHDRARDLFKEPKRCAFSRWKAEDDWDCDCDGWVEEVAPVKTEEALIGAQKKGGVVVSVGGKAVGSGLPPLSSSILHRDSELRGNEPSYIGAFCVCGHSYAIHAFWGEHPCCTCAEDLPCDAFCQEPEDNSLYTHLPDDGGFMTR